MSKLLKQLKQQLEEKDKEIENLNFALRVEKNYYANSYKQNERLKQQLADALKDFNDIQKENDKLAQQLIEEKNKNKKLNHEAQKYYEDAYCNGSQNEKAIAELNNILDTFAMFVNEEKESIVSPDENGNLSLLEYIENRIDTLKGAKEC